MRNESKFDIQGGTTVRAPLLPTEPTKGMHHRAVHLQMDAELELAEHARRSLHVTGSPPRAKRAETHPERPWTIL